MYIVAIGWLYVVLVMAMTASSWFIGIIRLLFYGIFPLALLLWLFGGRRRKRLRMAVDELANQSDGGDAAGNHDHLLNRGSEGGTPVQPRD